MASAYAPYLVVLLSFLAVVFIVRAITEGMQGHRIKSRVDAVVEGTRSSKRRRLPRLDTAKFDNLIAALSRLSLPEQGWQTSEVALKFIRAGFRSATAPRTYYAIKSLLAIVFPLTAGVFLFVAMPSIGISRIGFIVVIIAAAGYYGPDMFLRSRTESRAKEMRETLPDLLDLLVIAIESGLGVDAALNRVSREIVRASPVLAEEFYLTSLEIRAGAGRIPALKNLALRVNIDDLSNLVAMLVQADKFGTSLGASLRIQSEVMRVKRMQRAEELAAKIPVKMLFPLIFFIFPALMIVILGPAMLSISATFGAK